MPYHHEHYNNLLVLLSVLIAFLSLFTALDLAERLARKRKGPLFIALNASVMGLGMWCMHFIGMLAMDLEVPVSYNLLLLAVSLVVPLAASALLLMLINRTQTRNRAALTFGGVLLSGGILVMHYTGMLAIIVSAEYRQSAASIIASVLCTLVVPAMAMAFRPEWLAKPYNMLSTHKMLFAVILTASLVGTHYTAMTGASFVPNRQPVEPGTNLVLDETVFSLVLSGTFILIVVILLVLLYRDRSKVLSSAKFNEERYTALFEHSPDMVICLDPAKQKIISANASLRETTGYGKEELLDYKHILADRTDEARLKSAVKLAALGQSSKLEAKIITRAGNVLVCSLTVFPAGTKTMRLVYIVGEDITALADYQRDLIIAKEAAEEAARVKGQFLATMSHEIRTPLNGIIGINQLLTDELTDEGQLSLLELQNRSSQALLGVMNDLLDLSSLRADELKLKRGVLNLPELVQQSIELFDACAAEKNITLHLEYQASGTGRFIGDGVRLRQVLVNLIGNAVKFTSSGSIRLRVEPLGIAASGEMLKFSIVDTGIGLDPEKLDLLFKPFSQVDASFTRKYSGPGLGLAISKELVELMGGSIGAEQAPGGGALFSFTVPLQPVLHAVDEAQEEQSEAEEEFSNEAV
ncbi:MHYT domain-containing protein [Paenibacillus sp. NFR01]|uniref:MHYT domain-containing protein n=1 Tax=Paenibacillus sp. NFR01 TaxID=1566279 RepID=UPI0008CD3A28|nr:MHYT domain-containing protein [Paenibacillus sp. NFR01]SET29882.1 PAS domain S-box-containing protein [Paenibacillus sp. NFR01]